MTKEYTTHGYAILNRIYMIELKIGEMYVVDLKESRIGQAGAQLHTYTYYEKDLI